MEGIVIWIVIIIGWAILKGVFSAVTGSGGDDSSSSVEANPFTVKVKKGLPPKDTGLSVDCYNVELKGMISHPTDDQVKIILLVQDVTDNDNENDAGAPVLSAHEAFAEKGSRVLGVERIYNSSSRTYFPDWTLFVPVPVDFIVPPHKGKRRIKFLLCVGDADTTVDRGGVNDTSKLIHISKEIVNFTFKEPGYMDELVNRDKVEDLTIKLGMCMAAADGTLDQKELNIIKTWAKNLTSLLEDDKAQERNAHFSKFLKSSAIAAKTNKISLSNLVKDFNDVASKTQKYTAIQLLLDISGADGTLSKEEDVFINKIAKTTGINLSTFKEMKNKVIANVDNIDLSEKPSEESFGLTEDMDDAEKMKVLRKEYTKWNGQTNHKDPKKKKRAKEMVKIIADLRKQYSS
ncbi:TerB family tellurite resistance protein [Candidatus Pelagibacter ubique]|nr:TerB family tellurite resistance protein [Candidatus Pelagibacter ubique]